MSNTISQTGYQIGFDGTQKPIVIKGKGVNRQANLEVWGKLEQQKRSESNQNGKEERNDRPKTIYPYSSRGE